MTIETVGREVRAAVPASEASIAERVAKRHAELTRLSLSGIDVTADLEVLAATSENLSERTREIINERVTAWVMLAVRIGAKVGLGITIP